MTHLVLIFCIKCQPKLDPYSWKKLFNLSACIPARRGNISLAICWGVSNTIKKELQKLYSAHANYKSGLKSRKIKILNTLVVQNILSKSYRWCVLKT